MNVWCGASSSGQEPYSVMFTIFEHFPELKNWVIQFSATDLSEEMLAKCRAGKYSQLEVNRGLPVTCLTKFFSKKGMGWQVQEDIRRRIDFKYMNLIGPWLPFPTIDIVFLRNVMIYFDRPTQAALIGKFYRYLRPGGFLFIGHSESLQWIEHQFSYIQPTIYQKPFE